MSVPEDAGSSTVNEARPLNVALLGCGVVGSQVARLLLESADDLTERVGRPLELVGIGVRDASKDRPGVPAELLTDDSEGLVSRGDIDIVVEVMGGIEPARQLILSAIEHGASIVTANKALIAQDGQTIFTAAEAKGVDVYYEAAVAGAIPIIRPLRESLIGDEILNVIGIVNGTTNYILDQMTTEHVSFDAALAQAQELGYAETDPSGDVEGLDAAYKAAILASLAFHTQVRAADVYCQGITDITVDDIAAAQSMSCAIKMIAVIRRTESDSIEVRVHPAMLPLSHPLASVSGANNAVFVQSREAGELMFMGPGAGGAPTASAVMGDLVTVARNVVRGAAGPAMSLYTDRSVAPMGSTVTRYFMSFQVMDEPGVLAAVAKVFSGHNVSLQTVQQTVSNDAPDETLVTSAGSGDGSDSEVVFENPTPGSATLGIMTHQATETDVQRCIQEFSELEYVSGEIRMIRVEGM